MTASNRLTRRCMGLVMALLLLFPVMLEGQYTRAPAHAAYALENVTVIHPDGRQEVGVNIVVRRGLIEALGPDVPIPADAELLEGDSLFVIGGASDKGSTVKVRRSPAAVTGDERRTPPLS